MSDSPKAQFKQQPLWQISLAALGIVYGDIGTSPLYAFRETLEGLPIDIYSILGVLSLIFWSLILVVSIKYLVVLFRANNRGEGGILALLALTKRARPTHSGLFLLIAIFGAGLMLGDGMLTPAISVLSAIEGLNVIVPDFSNWVTPLTCIILISLFSVQSYGTARIGFVFGPVILVWFATIALLGAYQVFLHPEVLMAMNPRYGLDFIIRNGWQGYSLLGGVFLVMTGAEALYADLGHFGKTPIRASWFWIVLPSLCLNYFGQGGYLLTHPQSVANPFYLMAPNWFSFPLLLIATLATIIASQAVISATFSLTKQAVLLGLYPHLPIIQTSGATIGQVYIPQMNLILAMGTLFLILAFHNSNALTHAYGIAVNLVMVLTSILILYMAFIKRKGIWFGIGILSLFFFFIDMVFLGANLRKLATGGWVPVVFALFCTFVMYTWSQGRLYLYQRYQLNRDKMSKVLQQLAYQNYSILPKITAIFITDIYDRSGSSFLNFLELNKTLPEHILILNYRVENIPYVSSVNRFKIHLLNENICELTLRYGFMDTISIPQALYVANDRGVLPFTLNIEKATYLLEIPNVVASRKLHALWFYWQDKLFAFLVRNYSANLNIEFYQLPFDRTVGIGTYYMI